MSIKIMAAVWEITALTSTQKIVLLSLADQSNDDGYCWPSAASTSSRTGLCERSTRSTIADLEKMGHLSRKVQTGKATIYRIHPCIKCTPALNAPLHHMPEPLHLDSLTPASDSNITVRNPKEPLSSSVAVAPAKQKRSSRLSPDWKLPKSLGEWAVQQGLSAQEVHAEADKFRDYWIAKSGKDATKADWSATWRNWIRNRKNPIAKPVSPGFIEAHTDRSWAEGL